MRYSADELNLLLLTVPVALVTWWRRFWCVLSVSPLVGRGPLRWTFVASAAACTVLLFVALRTVSAHDVRDDGGYVFLYQVFGAAWVGLAAVGFRFLGISDRDDVVERRNGAAAAALSGALLGATLCYTGSNIGDGPGWWCVLFTAFLATAAWFALWTVLERLTAVSESVVVERDVASGLRLGGFLVGTGLVLGRAAAGDWTTAGAAAADFVRIGWPAAAMAGAAVVSERVLRPTPRACRRSWFAAGVLPAGAHVAVGAAWAWGTRPWA